MIKKLRKYLSENSLDYLLVNTTDEFLVEYNELTNCSRYYVTGFSGSTGDALISGENLWQFADGRYHEQADKETDPKTTTVVKLQLGESFLEKMVEIIKPDSTLGVVSKKISLNFYKILKKKCLSKGIKIKVLDHDPVELFQELKTAESSEPAKKIDIKIAGVSADEKFLKIAKKLRKKQVYLETNLENIAYLTNLRQYKTPFSSVFKAKLAIYKDRAVIFTDEKIEIPGEHFETKPMSEFKDFIPEKFEALYVPSTINLADFRLIKRNAAPLRKNRIALMKSIKNDAEIAHFKKNFERTDKVVEKISEMIATQENLNEKELSDAVEKGYLEQSARQLSFKTILAAGANSSIIHYSHPSRDVRVTDGDFVLLDCGGHFEGGYSTDITRTFIKGMPDELQKRVYTTVLKMFLNAYHHKVTSKTTGATLDRIARKIAKKSGLLEEGFNFNHGLGHGVGINVHEMPPTISSGAWGRKFLKENMIFTIEPGLYKSGFGGVRLENTVYLTKKDGDFVIQSLSKMKFEPKCIDESLLNAQEKIWLKNWQEQNNSPKK